MFPWAAVIFFDKFGEKNWIRNTFLTIHSLVIWKKKNKSIMYSALCQFIFYSIPYCIMPFMKIHVPAQWTHII